MFATMFFPVCFIFVKLVIDIQLVMEEKEIEWKKKKKILA
jgi:hypothetical protein